MELETILTAISTVGFPIVMCLIIFYQNEKTIDTLKDTINNNSAVTKELIAKIDILINFTTQKSVDSKTSKESEV